MGGNCLQETLNVNRHYLQIKKDVWGHRQGLLRYMIIVALRDVFSIGPLFVFVFFGQLCEQNELLSVGLIITLQSLQNVTGQSFYLLPILPFFVKTQELELQVELSNQWS